MTANSLKLACRSGLAAAVLVGGVGTAQADIFIDDSTGAIYDVDVGTRAATLFATPDVTMRDIAFVGNVLYGIDESKLYTIDPTDPSNSTTTPVGDLASSGDNTGMNALFYDGATLFGMSFTQSDLFTIATSGTGPLATAVGFDWDFTSEGDIEQSTTSGNLYVTTTTDGSATSSDFNEITKIGTTPVGGVSFDTGVNDVWGLAYFGSTLYGAAGSNLYTIDPNTTTVTDQGTITLASGGDLEVAFGATRPVPLPAAAWLFGSAMLGMIGVGRYARKKASA